MPLPPFPPPTGEFSSHRANCHCGAVRWRFAISPPLDSYPVIECNCSICHRHGYLLVYPSKENVKLESGSECALRFYTFAQKLVKHQFCNNCGSNVFFEILNPPNDGVAELEASKETLPTIVGMNLRMITGLELDKLTIRKIDGEARGPKYSV